MKRTLFVLAALAACDLTTEPTVELRGLLGTLECRSDPAPVIHMETGDTAHIWFRTLGGVVRDAVVVLEDYKKGSLIESASWYTLHPGVYDRAMGTLTPARPQSELATVMLADLWPESVVSRPVGHIFNMNGCDVLVLAAFDGSSVQDGDPARRYRSFDVRTDDAWPPAPGVVREHEVVEARIDEARTARWFDGDLAPGITVRRTSPHSAVVIRLDSLPVYEVTTQTFTYRYRGLDIRFEPVE